MTELNDEIERLASMYFITEDLILKKIAKLPEFGKPCKCNDSTNFMIVDNDIIVGYCLNCGGDIDF